MQGYSQMIRLKQRLCTLRTRPDGHREMGEDLADDFPPCEVLCYKDKHQRKTDYQHQLPNARTHIGDSRQQQVHWCHHQ